MICLNFIADEAEAYYDTHHATVMSIFSFAFGMLSSNTFFLKMVEIQPLFALKVTEACCILHHVCAA